MDKNNKLTGCYLQKMKSEFDIDQLEQQKNKIEQLLEKYHRKLNTQFDSELEQQFWHDREIQLINMLRRACIPTLCIFFMFMCVSLTLNYLSADAMHRDHDFSRNFISFAATWIALITLFAMVKKQAWNHLYTPIISLVVCFALAVNLSIQLTMLSLPVIWRGTIVMALSIVFVYLFSGLRPRIAFFSSMAAVVLTIIYIKWVNVSVPLWVIANTLVLPNLVGLALAILSISTERIRFLQSIIIEYDKQIYSQLNQHFIQLSHQDTLTMLGNRRGFEQHLQDAIDLTKNTKKPFAILFIDVDYFKLYNDLYEHDHGDNALIRVAQTLLRHIRQGDVAIRYGGEEFIVLLKQINIQHAEQIANNILEDIRAQKIEHKNSNIADYLTVSIGVTVYEGQHEMSYPELLKIADQALYLAKNYGRDRYQIL